MWLLDICFGYRRFNVKSRTLYLHYINPDKPDKHVNAPFLTDVTRSSESPSMIRQFSGSTTR